MSCDCSVTAQQTSLFQASLEIQSFAQEYEGMRIRLLWHCAPGMAQLVLVPSTAPGAGTGTRNPSTVTTLCILIHHPAGLHFKPTV